MNERVIYAIAVVLLLAGIGVGAWYWWQQRQPLPPLQPSVATAPPPPAAPAAPAQPPPIQHPIENVAPEAKAKAPLALPAEPAQADAVVQRVLVDLVGRHAVFAFLNTDGFARRFVATVDNLPRKQASPLSWPVVPTGGRFTTSEGKDGATLSATNSERYAPFVKFVQSVDTKDAVSMYVRLYPQLQKAYEELGYPGRYFNDRLIAVIDHLLATPEPKAPPQLELPEFKGPVQPTRPWVLVEFAEPSLESLSAGQKIMLRVGSANAQVLKAKLADIRKQIVRSGAAR